MTGRRTAGPHRPPLRKARASQRTWVTFLLGLGFLLVPDPGAAQGLEANQLPEVELPPELAQVLRGYEAAWGQRDAEGLAQLFTEDGFVLRPGHPPVRGRPAIREAYANSGGPLVLRAYGYAVEGDVGYIVGGYAGHEADQDDGKFVLAIRRGPDGRWLIAADMDNGNG